jgi:enterochelin esterase family protein
VPARKVGQIEKFSGIAAVFYLSESMTFRILAAIFVMMPIVRAQDRETPVSPDVLTDHRVVFRLDDPFAKAVQVKGILRTPVEMQRSKNGVWHATLGPIDPGIYDYSFIVDGEQVIDPSNPEIKPERNPDTSSLEITTDTPLFYQWKNVQHGVVHLHSYYSPSLKRLRRLRVYTPPGYDQNPSRRYPVLYLFHGTGDTEATWTEFGRANYILDNLIADGKAVPMLLVMPDGHADLQDEEGVQLANFNKFEADMIGSIMPLVDSSYRTIATSAGRAINGLSLGGMQSLEIGINHPDLFAYIGGMSAYVPHSEDLIAEGLKNKNLNDQVKLLWVSIGKDDYLLKDAESFHSDLEKRGIHVQWTLTEGSHEWTVWRKYLNDFAPLLFGKGG